MSRMSRDEKDLVLVREPSGGIRTRREGISYRAMSRARKISFYTAAFII